MLSNADAQKTLHFPTGWTTPLGISRSRFIISCATLANQGKNCGAVHFKLGLLLPPNSSPQLYLWLSGGTFPFTLALFSVGYAPRAEEKLSLLCVTTTTTRSSSADEAILQQARKSSLRRVTRKPEQKKNRPIKKTTKKPIRRPLFFCYCCCLQALDDTTV